MFATPLTPSQVGDDVDLHAEIRDSVQRVLASGDWARYRSDVSDALRAEIARQLGVGTVRLCSSGSVAMELALHGCHLHAADEVICPALDYPGNVRAVRLLGATPVIVDSAPGRWTVDADQVASAGSERTRAVIVSHLYGEIAEVDRLRDLCDQRGWLLVEDVCQMPGGKIGDRALGSFGHVSAFSFGGSKPLTSGSGGAVVTNDTRIGQRISTHADRPSDAYSMSGLQAAVLLPQWQRLDRLVDRQCDALDSLLRDCRHQTPQWSWPSMPDEGFRRSFYKVPIQIAAPLDGSPLPDRMRRTEQLLSQMEIAAGTPFRTLSKVVSGRGRLVGWENAHRLATQSFLLNHRDLVGSSEHRSRLTAKLIAVHDETAG